MDLQGGVWSEGRLVDKVVSAMSSAQNPHGGQEQTIQAIYTTMMHWGAIIVPPGYSDDSLFVAGGNKRTVEIAGLLKFAKENQPK